jgi:hypothetical protein
VSATSLSKTILNLSQHLAESLRGGNALVSDARATVHNIREAEGWLQSARRFLDPGDPLAEEGRTDA